MLGGEGTFHNLGFQDGVPMERVQLKDISGAKSRIVRSLKITFIVLAVSLGWEFVLMHEVLGKPFGANEALIIGSGCLAVALRSLLPSISLSAGALVFLGGMFLGPKLVALLSNGSSENLPQVKSVIFPLIYLIIGFLPLGEPERRSDVSTVDTTSVRSYFKDFTTRKIIGLTFNTVAVVACILMLCRIIFNEMVGYDGYQMMTAFGVLILSAIAWDRTLSIFNQFDYNQPLVQRLVSIAAVAFFCPILVFETADWGERVRTNTLMQPMLKALDEQYDRNGTVPYLITNPEDYLSATKENRQLLIRRGGITYVSDGKSFVLGIRGNSYHPDTRTLLSYDSCSKKWQKRDYDCIAGHCISSGPHASKPRGLQSNDIRPYFTGQEVKPSCSTQNDFVVWSKYDWNHLKKRWMLDIGDFSETELQTDELVKQRAFANRQDELRNILAFFDKQKKKD